MAAQQFPRVRWLAPVVAAGVALGVPVALTAQASAEPPLPPLTASQLLVELEGVRPLPLSGEIKQVANLGVPELPGLATPAVKEVSAASLISLATGTHTWRVWTDGAHGARVALLAAQGETDVITNGRDLWVWSSADSSATHTTLPDIAKRPAKQLTPTEATPAEIADKLLSTLDPTTEVTTTRADRVAGRPVYNLVLTPTQAGTKVGQVRLSVDAETKVPLRVLVTAHDGTLALDVAFTSISFAKPDAALFTFTPPAGTTVTDGSASGPAPTAGHGTRAPGEAPAKPKVVGSSWTSVVVAEFPVAEAAGATPSRGHGPSASIKQTLDGLPRVSGTWGSGRLLDAALLSVVLTDDGRIAAGAVTPDQLYAALAR